MSDFLELGRKMLKNKHYAIVKVRAKRNSQSKLDEMEESVRSIANKDVKESVVIFETENIEISRLIYVDDNVFYLIVFSTNKEDIFISIHDNERKFELFIIHEKMKERNENQVMNLILRHIKENYKKQFGYSF